MRISSNSSRAQLLERLRLLEGKLELGCELELYRFINPRFSKAHDIIGGTGGLHASGRWNLGGEFRISYTSLVPETALAEVLAHVRYFNLPLSRAMPTVLVALGLKARRVLDFRSSSIRAALKLSPDAIRKIDWRLKNQDNLEALTQAWGWTFAEAGLEAVIVLSGADSKGANVLVYPGNLLPGSRFFVKSAVRWPGK